MASPHPERPHPALAAVADALGLTPDELRDELLAGHTLAHMASTRGVDADVVADALAAAEPTAPPSPTPPSPTPGMAAPDDLAALVGLTAEELHEAEASGRTLAEIAEANGVPRAKLIDALVTRSAHRIQSLTD